MKLNQAIALSRGVRANAQKALTTAYHEIAKAPQFAGITKTYSPRDEEGEKLAGEHQKVQATGERVIDDVHATLAKMYDLIGGIDLSNCDALADVMVEGNPILTNVPATHLLWLEKQLGDMRAFIGRLPTLDPQYRWSKDNDNGWYETEDRVTMRSKKVPRNHEKAPATDKHPAQVEVFYEDVVVGDWHTKVLSGALPPSRVKILLERVDILIGAVKTAREQANMNDAVTLESSRLLDWLFRP